MCPQSLGFLEKVVEAPGQLRYCPKTLTFFIPLDTVLVTRVSLQ